MFVAESDVPVAADAIPSTEQLFEWLYPLFKLLYPLFKWLYRLSSHMLKQRIETPYGNLTANWTALGLYACSFDRVDTSDVDTSDVDTSDVDTSDNALQHYQPEVLGNELGRALSRAKEFPSQACGGASGWSVGNQVGSCDQLKELALAFRDFFKCGSFVWNLDRLDWTGVSKFHRHVLHECFAIPAGRTTTYGQLATRAGSPKAARAVGAAMARNRWPILIPCHRVVGSTGNLTGYSGAGGLETKRHLLALEQARCTFELTNH